MSSTSSRKVNRLQDVLLDHYASTILRPVFEPISDMFTGSNKVQAALRYVPVALDLVSVFRGIPKWSCSKGWMGESRGSKLYRGVSHGLELQQLNGTAYKFPIGMRDGVWVVL